MRRTSQARKQSEEKFDYKKAFSRNLGYLRPEEQELISKFCIAIPGMGGVGGHNFHALLRLGFCKFKIADLDEFGVENFNRQFGSSMSAVGREKVEVLREIALDINPEAKIEIFSEGITKENIESFLDGVDIVVDGLDLYASELRTPLYQRAYERNCYVVSAGPFGMGTSVMAFHPGKMSFTDYFDLDKPGLTKEAQIVRFLVGMSPYMLHRKYIAFPEAVDLVNGRLPSLHSGVYSASAALSSTVLKLALNRGKVLFAPHGIQTDFYLNKQKKFWRPWGNRNYIQRFIIKRVMKMFEMKEFY
ncbi:MAG: ThiF family adenylyltransferase [Bdellovibrionota bacterium]|nr:ThiF family adenylyltransferase [Bdellovibrionota bacterium]